MTVGFNKALNIKHCAVAMIGSLLIAASLNVAANVTVKDAWIRAAPPSSTVLAGYLTLVNDSNQPIAIQSIRSPDFTTVEIHESITRDGRTQMQHHPSITIDANSSVKFEPNGKHLMLIEPRHRMQLGTSSILVFKLDNGQEINISVDVKSADAVESIVTPQ